MPSADLLVTTGIVIFAGLIFLMVFRDLNPNIHIVLDDYAPCRGGWHEAYLNACETGLHRIPQQPVNTYTNLAYLAAGLYTHRALETDPSFVFAITMAYLCIGSTLYHALSTRWSGTLDVTGIYVVYSAVAVYAAANLFGLGESAWSTALMAVLSGLVALQFRQKFRRHMDYVIAFFLGLAYLLTLARMAWSGDWGAWRLLLLSVVLFSLAFSIWQMDRRKSFPLPRWGHGLWHLLTAASSAILFYAIDYTN